MAGKSFVQITRDVSKALYTLRAETPEAMNGFSQLARGALRDGALPALHKELIALAIGVSSRCDACIGFNVKTLIGLGVARGQLMEARAICTYMGGGPTLMYAAEAVRAYEEFQEVGAKVPA
ncbi:carboxymuconolactone decarboxylase family protein [Aromatoleum toluclasticum]|uniref:carboxymuconolactone decarboxylase family protein n=1 Tax=Aromatoleum toluclasticum TaxID=92003 RepID=UPI00036EB1C9|nr:carboxymuconolactone decarboxylase family protein [Aromatoleum toluclasticum]